MNARLLEVFELPLARERELYRAVVRGVLADWLEDEGCAASFGSPGRACRVQIDRAIAVVDDFCGALRHLRERDGSTAHNSPVQVVENVCAPFARWLRWAQGRGNVIDEKWMEAWMRARLTMVHACRADRIPGVAIDNAMRPFLFSFAAPGRVNETSEDLEDRLHVALSHVPPSMGRVEMSQLRRFWLHRIDERLPDRERMDHANLVQVTVLAWESDLIRAWDLVFEFLSRQVWPIPARSLYGYVGTVLVGAGLMGRVRADDALWPHDEPLDESGFPVLQVLVPGSPQQGVRDSVVQREPENTAALDGSV